MKSKLIFFFIVLCFLNPIIGFTQGMLKNFEMSLGFSTQKQDRRLFDWPTREEIIQRETSHNDYQIEILLNKNVLSKNKFILSCGLGYSLYKSTFGRPFNDSYFNGENNLWVRYIENYLVHNLKLNSTFKYNLIYNNNSKISLILPLGFNFDLNKHIKSGTWKENKWKFEFNNLDIYSGCGYESGKFAYYISYRILNFQKIDRVIYNGRIFSVPSDPILTKKYELNKLTNFKVNIGYQF